jgi:hypothetical protein
MERQAARLPRALDLRPADVCGVIEPLGVYAPEVNTLRRRDTSMDQRAML